MRSRKGARLAAYPRPAGDVCSSAVLVVISSLVSRVLLACEPIARILEVAYVEVFCFSIPLIIYTNLLSLYECIVKLGTTKEKRLIINIIALRQIYEVRDL